MICTRRRTAEVWVHPQAHDWWDKVVPSWNNIRFISNFRVSRRTFKYICQRLAPVLQRRDTNYCNAIPVDKRVAMAIWRMATNECYRTISNLFGVGIATVCHCLQVRKKSSYVNTICCLDNLISITLLFIIMLSITVPNFRCYRLFDMTIKRQSRPISIVYLP